jgi:hypothetical protein
MNLRLWPWRLIGFVLVLVNLWNASRWWHRGNVALGLVQVGLALYVVALWLWVDRKGRELR